MDAKLWTAGATLFALLYLTLAVTLVWTVVVVALVMAAWVLSLETEGPEGLRYVELEMRPALAMVGIFSLTVVVLGPHFPPLLSRSLFPVQYASSLAVMHATPVLFFFPLVPLLTGFVMSVHQSLHPVQGIVYQTPTTHSTKVHVHLHNARAARTDDDEEEEDEEESPRPKHPHHRLRSLGQHLHRPRRVRAYAASTDAEDEDDDEDEEEAPTPKRSRHGHRRAIHASETAEL